MNSPATGSTSPSGSGRRSEVLGVLRRANGPVRVADVAQRLGVHANTVRFHLDHLVEEGQVERVSPEHRTPGRPPHLFRIVPGMDPAGPRRYQMLAEVLGGFLLEEADPAARATEAGRAWGRRHAASAGYESVAGQETPASEDESLARLTTVLDEIGFAPERHEDRPASAAPEIRLRHCPFLELASTTPEITCPVHLGLMQGALEAWESPVTVDRLEPFVEPDLCVAHLSAAAGA